MNDLHVLDLATWTWFAPRQQGAALPAPRKQAAAAFSPDRRLLLFGGRTNGARLNGAYLVHPGQKFSLTTSALCMVPLGQIASLYRAAGPDCHHQGANSPCLPFPARPVELGRGDRAVGAAAASRHRAQPAPGRRRLHGWRPAVHLWRLLQLRARRCGNVQFRGAGKLLRFGAFQGKLTLLPAWLGCHISGPCADT